jgi:glycine cleavage system regulatory protein
MEPFDSIEKLITEHGSATILREHINLLKSQMMASETKHKQDAFLIESQTRLLKEKDIQIKNLQTQKPADECPFCHRLTLQLIEIKRHSDFTFAACGMKEHFYKCSNQDCSKDYVKTVSR